MKKSSHYLFIIACAVVLSLLLSTQGKEEKVYADQENAVDFPKEEDKEEMKRERDRGWTEQEAQEYASNFALVQQSIEAAKSAQLAKQSDAQVFTDVALFGNWKCRGPYNMPGAFAFCEVDESTDTVYTVTYGHYGGVQFIWKGPLSGDQWSLLNPKEPSRFEDLILIPNGNKKRLIAAKENGKIIYTDDEGKTWLYSTGIPAVLKSTIVNRQDNNVLYTTDGRNVYKSTDKGTSFTLFQSVVSFSKNSRLYSPRWNVQPNAADVYLAIDTKFYKLNAGKTAFDPIGTLPIEGEIRLGGDSRKLWATLGDRKWHSSEDGGVNWKYRPTTNANYANAEKDMVPGHYLAVHPEDPNILIGGYTTPVSTRDGGVTTNIDAGKYWGYYQNSVGSDAKLRNNYHPDVRGSQFFYDRTGKLYSLRCTDGGVFRSYNEWTKTSFPDAASIQNNVFYNISLYTKPSQESYRGSFMYGYQNSNHLTTGTQDQGMQNTRNTVVANGMFPVDARGGDGPCCITGDGKTGWIYNYGGGNGKFKRVELYNGSTYNGSTGSVTESTDFTINTQTYMAPSVGDWNDGNRMWVLGKELVRVEYNTSNKQITVLEKNLSGSNDFVQGIAQSRLNPSIIYAMQDGHIFKSTDRGTNWAKVANQTATGIGATTKSRGMGWSSPQNQNIVLFASQSSTPVKTVFSKDGGITWVNVTGTGANLFPPADVNGMAGTSDGNLVFASTSMGPYVFVVKEEKWYPLAVSDQVPVFWGQIVYCVKYGNQEIVRFSTWGQGFWDFEINSTTTAIEANHLTETHMEIYPNPAAEFIHVNFAGQISRDALLSIYDYSGRLVQSKKVTSGNETIDLFHYAPGVYVVTITNGEKQLRKTFVKK